MQAIYDIAEICARKGIDTVVISPGSRSAPLTLAFARHPHIEKFVVLDERCAAYMALGMAQASGKTVALICTSGTAVLNFAPAVAEAFYLNIPLLILTADRPPEWIDQADGQSIRQQHIFGGHVKKFFQLPADNNHSEAQWHINRSVNEAINLCRTNVHGPVHLNIPLREPLYPASNTPFSYSDVRIIHRTALQPKFSVTEWDTLREEFNSTDKKLLVLGQQAYSPEFIRELKNFCESTGTSLVADVLGNAHFMKGEWIRHQDLFLGNLTPEQTETLRPELLISIGNTFISKNLKQFLRKQPARMHWHIAEGDSCPDTFRTLTRHIPVAPLVFLKEANRTSSGFDTDNHEAYSYLWYSADTITAVKLKEYQKDLEHSDFSVTYQLLQQLPSNSVLHAGNSMAVRYVNFIGLSRPVEVFSNRGTSGIDGCISTAIGAAWKTTKTVTLLLGDLSFFYDSNALFQEKMPDNLKIVVLNNYSGNIFSMIDGPSHLPEGKRYFETGHKRSVRFMAEGYGIAYLQSDGTSTVKKAIKELYELPGCAILEVHTDPVQNSRVLKGFSAYLKKWVTTTEVSI